MIGHPLGVPGLTVGLLGGSFDPPHEGHVHITKQAIKAFNLSRIWWLVSPGNPLKEREPQTISKRFKASRKIMQHPAVTITNIESSLRSRFTAETIYKLQHIYPGVKFVWLMGADNLEQIPRWARWARIFQTVHVAVFDRSPYSHKVLYGRASKRFARRRLQALHGKAFWATKDSRWIYFSQRRHPASSTGIRRGGMLSSIINSY